jgi:hypothetical protein
MAGTVNSYLQVNIQNKSNGANASSDYVATADNGTDTTNYIDLGINSSGYSQAGYDIIGAGDGYLYTNGGNLAIGTQTSGKEVRFHIGGTAAANLHATLNDNGFVLPAGHSYLGGLKVRTSNVTNSTATPANITGLTWAVTSGTEYGFVCVITHLGTATSGSRFNVNGPTMTAYNVEFQTHTAPTTAPVYLHATAVSAAASTAACTSSCNATVMTSRISGTFTPSASGTAAIMLTSSTASQTVTVYRGSYCDVR